jgi:hypothetical protein
MKIRLLFLSTLLFSFSISAQIDFEVNIVVENHPDVMGPYTANSADIDGDGDKDILATSTNGDKIVWFENLDGQGNFSVPIIISTGLDYPIYLEATDMDGDGDLDIVTASTYDDKISWYKNLDGVGNFGSRQIITTLEYTLVVHTSDIDNDGDNDIVAAGDHLLVWLENIDGQGSFSSQKIISDSILTSEAFEISDMDNDGDMDITYSDSYYDKVVWFENTDGSGTFGPESLITDQAVGTLTVITKDIDGDGDLDVVTTSYPNEIGWHENIDGNGTFGPSHTIFTTPTFILKIFASDLDADGDNDVIALKYNEGKIIWFENEGTGSFGPEQILLENFTLSTSLYTDDYNNDGEMDILVTSFAQNKIIILENRGPLGIEESTANLFTLYPNPTNGLLKINSTLPVSEITVYNNLGQLLFNSEENNQVDISALSEGIYFVKIKGENGQTETKKVVKK